MASGTVLIWEENFVEVGYPDYRALIDLIPQMYQHTLGRTPYLVVYEDTERGLNWDEPDWTQIPIEHSKRLRDFIEWLRWATSVEGNAEWEVWT
jgi:hypothetical protein